MCAQQADLQFLADMAKYMQGDVPATTYPHAPLVSLIWWDWNPNSGNTGGIVEDDWLTVRVPDQAALAQERKRGLPPTQCAYIFCTYCLAPGARSLGHCTRQHPMGKCAACVSMGCGCCLQVPGKAWIAPQCSPRACMYFS